MPVVKLIKATFLLENRKADLGVRLLSPTLTPHHNAVMYAKCKFNIYHGAFLGHTPTAGDETQPGQLSTACVEQGRQWHLARGFLRIVVRSMSTDGTWMAPPSQGENSAPQVIKFERVYIGISWTVVGRLVIGLSAYHVTSLLSELCLHICLQLKWNFK